MLAIFDAVDVTEVGVAAVVDIFTATGEDALVFLAMTGAPKRAARMVGEQSFILKNVNNIQLKFYRRLNYMRSIGARESQTYPGPGGNVPSPAVYPGQSWPKYTTLNPFLSRLPGGPIMGAPVQQGVRAGALSQIRRGTPIPKERGNKIALYELREEIRKTLFEQQSIR